MPTWLKILLLVLVAGILAAAVLVVRLMWWSDARTKQVVKDAIEARKAGAAFGATHAQSECIDDGLAQVESCGAADFRCEGKVRMGLFACIPVARVDGTCRTVPADMAKARAWATAECARRGQSGSWRCEHVLTEVTPACYPP
jgi:hypothetical protein